MGFVFLFARLAASTFAVKTESKHTQPSIHFIAVDDLRPERRE